MSSWKNSRNISNKRYFINNTSTVEPITNSDILPNIEGNTILKTRSNVCLIPHYGLGDIICMIPVINYLCKHYNKVKVVCLSHNSNNFKSFFSDNPNVLYIIPKNEKNKVMDNYPFNEELHSDDLYDCDILRCGLHKEAYNKKYNIQTINIDYNKIPFSFYYDLNIQYNVFWNYFKLPDTNKEESIYNILNNNGITDYIFIHNRTSDGILSNIDRIWLSKKYNIDSNITLLINPNENMYNKGHFFYNLAEQFINKPILQYKDIIINASSIFLSNSAFFCLALHLDMKAINKIVFKRTATSLKYVWDIKYGYKPINNIFTEIIV
jgi:hypothetical protein